MRVLPPVYSPLTAAALMRAALTRPTDTAPLHAVEEMIRASYAPVDATLTDTGTSALRLALRAAEDVGQSPIAFPAYGCYDLVSAARGAAVRPIYYDIDPVTLGPDMESLGRAFDMGARSVLVAYLSGIPVDMDALRAFCDAHGALLIEDAAQGVGGEYRGRPLGAHGDLSVLSFARGKGRTGGGGGALLANTAAGADASTRGRKPAPARRKRGALSRSAFQWVMSRPTLYGLPRALPFLHLGETRYRDPRHPGSMAPATAALLANVWDASDQECDVRRRRAASYSKGLAHVPGIGLPTIPNEAKAGYLRFPVILRSPASRIVSAGHRFGIAPAYPKVLGDIDPAVGGDAADELSGARLLTTAFWTLPTHRYVTDNDAARIVALLESGG